MNKKAHYQTVTEPTVFVTKDKHRVKQYDDVIYLKDGDEFELELFNPTSDKVLAKITLNDHELDSGIVLRPGERVFLERYINEARKFIFETYEVDKDDPNVQRAIKDNGKVEVEFYMEKVEDMLWGNGTFTYHPPVYGPPHWTTSPGVYYSNTGPDIQFGSGDITVGCGDVGHTLTTSGDLDMKLLSSSKSMDRSFIQCSAQIEETGRVEKGSHSNQQLEYDNSKFNSWPTWRKVWKILPKSQKAFVKEELKVFCTNCGAQRKKPSHRFCPNCGNKF